MRSLWFFWFAVLLVLTSITVWYFAPRQPISQLAAKCNFATYSITEMFYDGGNKDEVFQKYATAVTDNLLARLASSKTLVRNKPGESSDIEIALFNNEYRQTGAATDQKLDKNNLQYSIFENFEKVPGASGTLSSPWVRVSVNDKTPCHVKAAFYLNSKQLLVDQALLRAGKIDLSLESKPLPKWQNELLLKIYDDWLYQNIGNLHQVSVDSFAPENPELRKSSRNALSKSIPPDLLWLFEQAEYYDGPGGFEDHFDIKAIRASLKLTENLEVAYGQLAVSIVNRFLTAPLHDESYDDFLQAATIFDVSELRVNKIYPNSRRLLEVNLSKGTQP
jgi:hypothetical protein